MKEIDAGSMSHRRVSLASPLLEATFTSPKLLVSET